MIRLKGKVKPPSSLGEARTQGRQRAKGHRRNKGVEPGQQDGKGLRPKLSSLGSWGETIDLTEFHSYL